MTMRGDVSARLDAAAAVAGLRIGSGFQRFYSGTYDDLYVARGGKSMLARVRVRYDESSGRGLMHQHRLLAEVPAGVAPRPLQLDCTQTWIPFEFRIEEFVDGTVPDRFDERLIGRVAGALGRLHRAVDMRPAGPIIHPDMLALLTADPARDHRVEALAASAREALELMPEDRPFALTHGDIHLGNILDTGKGCSLVDWEHVAYSDPALDVAILFWFSALMAFEDAPFDESQRTLFLTHYVDITGYLDIAARVRLYEPVVVALQLTSWYAKWSRAMQSASARGPSYRDAIERALRMILADSRGRNWIRGASSARAGILEPRAKV